MYTIVDFCFLGCYDISYRNLSCQIQSGVDVSIIKGEDIAMKSALSNLRANWILLEKIILAALLLFALAGCSNGDNQAEAEQSKTAEEIQQLTDENEKLHTELNETNDELKAAEAKVKELEHELETMREAQATPAPSKPIEAKITPPKRTPSESLVGSWFVQYFYEKDYLDNYIVNIVFNSDGTGTQNQVLYLPSELTADDYGTSDPRGEITFPFTWSLNGDAVHTVLQTALGTAFVDYKFLPEQQKLIVTNDNGESLEDQNVTLLREPIEIPDGYVAKSVIVGDIQAQEVSLRRKFLGMWYFDITAWTFNEDGTGILDIPDVANQPASRREFTYSATENGGNFMLTIDWADGGTAFFLTKMNDDGSITLGDDLKLTRQFDMNNCPISTQMIQTGLDVFTGRMFYDMLGIEE